MSLDRMADQTLQRHLKNYPSIAIVGPRQVGKTTTGKAIQKFTDRECIYLDLESDEDLVKS